MKKVTFLLAIALSCGSGTAFAQDYERVWVDVNFGQARTAEATRTTTFSMTDPFGDTASLSAVYDKPKPGGNFDFGGGYMFSPIVGAGVSISGNAHKDPAGLSITAAPFFSFDNPATGSDVTEDILERRERGVHMQAMINATPNSERLRVRVFGGPSHFHVQQHLVSDIQGIQQVFPNAVLVTDYTYKPVEANAWGYHGGADVGMFFNRTVGVGGTVKFSRATVTMADPLSEKNIDLKAGGVQVGGGLRFKF